MKYGVSYHTDASHRIFPKFNKDETLDILPIYILSNLIFVFY